ncbi:MAG: glutamate racemase [Candidatus Paceibacteria bacterium]|jgi:glutamate racemase
MKIGFFDSGLGGLSILKAVAKEMPNYDYVFYGDTANLPYGNKTVEIIYKYTSQGMKYLFEAGCNIVIIACNTASVETARRLQDEFLPSKYPDCKILGIIVPTIEFLTFNVPTKVLMIGTKRTVESGKFQLELDRKGNGNTLLTQISTPELVPLIEMNELEAAAKQAIFRIESEMEDNKVVVLGCTHYTQIKNQLRNHFGGSKIIISQDEVIPEKLRSYLGYHPEIECNLSRDGERSVHLTKHCPAYDLFMGRQLGGVYIDQD